jgi:hypothetical protein
MVNIVRVEQPDIGFGVFDGVIDAVGVGVGLGVLVGVWLLVGIGLTTSSKISITGMNL